MYSVVITKCFKESVSVALAIIERVSVPFNTSSDIEMSRVTKRFIGSKLATFGPTS